MLKSGAIRFCTVALSVVDFGFIEALRPQFLSAESGLCDPVREKQGQVWPLGEKVQLASKIT